MKRKTRSFVIAAAGTLIMLGYAMPALARLPGGCVQSPENPTVVLTALGAGVIGLQIAWSWWRGR